MSLIATSWADARRVIRFVAVGGLATLVHWSVAVASGRYAGLAPQAANFAGWCAAFCVSFTGQFGLTFGDLGAPVLRAARRFLLVSLTGFALNSMLYAGLRAWLPWPHEVLLALVLLSVAMVTYVLSRNWAFRGS